MDTNEPTGPTASPVVVRIERPTAAELRSALRAYRARGHVCGCHAQLSRNPFYRGVVGHFRTFHPDSLAMVADAQAQALLAIGEEFSVDAEAPWPARGLPLPIRIG